MNLFDIFPQLGVPPTLKAAFSVFRTTHYPEPFVISNDVAKPAGKLQKALTDSITAKANEPDRHKILKARDPSAADYLDIFSVPFTIADVTGAPPYPAAHHNGDEVDFDASEMKVAVLFAVFELRAMVRRYATQFAITTKAQLLKELKDLRPRIVDRVPEIKAAKEVRGRAVRTQEAQRLPDYTRSLTIDDSVNPMKIDFNGDVAAEPDATKKQREYDFGHSLFHMIVNSGDETARNRIDAIGYAFLNGALEAGGFFERPTPADPKTFRSLWVGGNFAFETIRGVMSVNDGPAQFGGTTRQFARLLALIRAGTFADPSDPGADLMAFLLRNAQSGTFKPALLKAFHGAFQYRQNKLGWAQLGINDPKANSVGSEVALLQKVKSDGSLGKLYAVAWQNMELVDQPNKQVAIPTKAGHKLYFQADIVQIITNSMLTYE